jgi:uncharacterized protein YqeY
MNLEQKIMADLKTAMLAKDEKTVRSLRAIKAAIILAKTSEGAGGEIKEEEEIKLLQKLVKQRKDSLEIYQQQNRPDLAQKEQEEIEVIEKFLPKQISGEELKAIIATIIAETGASSPADMGKVMGVATKQLAGKAEGKAISTLVKEYWRSRDAVIGTFFYNMIIDILVLIFLVMAVIKGLRRGLIVAVFSIFAFIAGIAAAMKLSVVVAGYLKDSVNISAKWLPFISFAVVFIGVVCWCDGRPVY